MNLPRWLRVIHAMWGSARNEKKLYPYTGRRLSLLSGAGSKRPFDFLPHFGKLCACLNVQQYYTAFLCEINE